MITDINQLDLNKKYTYTDYLTWRFVERVELIKGRIFKMSPAPNRRHQKISNYINVSIWNFLEKKSCEVYTAPFDVVLSKNDQSTVVQPDISVICDASKLTEQGCTGAPELIVEILSPGNSKKEMKEKFELYEENGVIEYWMVSPIEEAVTVYRLNEENKYIGSKPFVSTEEISSTVLPDLKLIAKHIFE